MSEHAVPAALATLTPAELRVAVAVGQGLSNRAAAEELFLSVKTVDHHLQRIYRKLGLRSRAELAVLVTRLYGEEGAAAAEAPFLAALAEQPDLPRLRGIDDPLVGFDAGAGGGRPPPDEPD